MGRTDSLEKTPILAKIEGKRRRGWQRTKQLGGITDSVDMSLNKLWKIAEHRAGPLLQSMGSKRVRHDIVTEQQHEIKGLGHKD